MNLLIDPISGAPRWDAAQQRLEPKEDFAFEAANRLLDGSLTLDELKQQILEAANKDWSAKGNSGRLHTLNDVKENIGKSAKDWFFELQRVAQDRNLLQELADCDGKGLTRLSRKAGPIQQQRRKGFADEGPDNLLKELISSLEQLRSDVLPIHEDAGRELSAILQTDTLKYREILDEVLNINDR